MKKTINITLVGICLLVAGIVMLISENIGVKNAKIMVPILFALAGAFSIKYSIANKDIKAASQFQLLQGIGLLIFAGVIAFLADGLTSFLMYVSYFMLMFGLIEIVMSFSVVNSKTKIIMEMLIYRLVGGFITAFGAVILLLTTFSDENQGLVIAGLLTVLIGISNIIYAKKIKGMKVQNGN